MNAIAVEAEVNALPTKLVLADAEAEIVPPLHEIARLVAVRVYRDNTPPNATVAVWVKPSPLAESAFAATNPTLLAI